MELRRVRLGDLLVEPLLAGLADEYDRRYGAGDDEMASAVEEEFDPPQGTFLVLLDGHETLAGGGIRRVSDDVCEVKRMWTAPEHRRKGYASTVLHALEDAARQVGYFHIRAETGPAQPEALSLYCSHGYREIPTYGPYDVATAFELKLAG